MESTVLQLNKLFSFSPSSILKELIMGDMSPRPMNDISILLDDIYYPILNNPANQEGWPEIIRKDIDLHIQDLRNVIAEVRIAVE
jgi:dynein heavy chain